MCFLTVLSRHTVIGFTLDANDSYLRLEGESSGCTFFHVLDLLGLSFPYVFPLTVSLTGSLVSGLFVVARSVIKILIPMSGRNP